MLVTADLNSGVCGSGGGGDRRAGHGRVERKGRKVDAGNALGSELAVAVGANLDFLDLRVGGLHPVGLEGGRHCVCWF